MADKIIDPAPVIKRLANRCLAVKGMECTILGEVIDMLVAEPAVEVVRCKDCKHYKERKKRCDHPCLDWELECYDLWLSVEPDDYCSYGERRNNGK